MSEPFFTIGHSTRTLAEFIDLLQGSRVELVVDVRRLPGSARYPQFDQDPFSVSLGEAGIGYRRVEGLTGRRPVSREVPFEVNAWWENRSFHNYADHALSEDFRHALAELREWGGTRRAAVMCSEAVWWRCHRRIIADHLLAHGEHVWHILGRDHVDDAQPSVGAVMGSDGEVRYPATR
ncbi:DUF488 domain-containing protein [Brachybacterium aquaticum]|uniref:Uncharacterized protein (DUF488 family) n=1 Tax=Brachybacterium aquaticum TaxID=1432564 RepID=A0A841ABQ4_9MICO|nr:DUF488 domain-containing protein [Brachybacterium aquaticum]MBB5831051.1 uncharacterized protein (DUF488 family) [Brachybacterium aquaticum]